MNLVVYRNYDGNRRIFFLRKVDFSVGQVLLTDLKIAFDKVLSFLGCIHLHHFTRMENGSLPVAELLASYRALWIAPVKCLSELAAHLENDCLMTI